MSTASFPALGYNDADNAALCRSELKFECGMGMLEGTITVTPKR